MKLKSLLFALLSVLSLHMMATTPEPPTEVGELASRIEATVFPNPSNGVFFLELKAEQSESFQVKIFNLIGRTIASEKIETNQEFRFDLSTQPKGVYFIQVESDKEQFIKRLVLR
ncbi:MAG: T9SS type A sorting domain-containing protein [Bacteroidota bacterium]